jgi:hypothetical protein
MDLFQAAPRQDLPNIASRVAIASALVPILVLFILNFAAYP